VPVHLAERAMLASHLSLGQMNSLRHYQVRLKRSARLRYRIPRLLVAPILLILLIFAFAYIVSGPR
jgi:hypothetical protein